MSKDVIAGAPELLRCAAVWGTTVLRVEVLERGTSFTFGDGSPLPIPDDVEMSTAPLRAIAGGWVLDPKGARGGTLTLRGRPESPVALAASGAPIPVMPGDYGLVQYGMLSVFFQYTQPSQVLVTRRMPEVLALLAITASGFFHTGILGLLRTLTTPPAIPKPLELTTQQELAARFGLSRPIFSEPTPTAANDTGGGEKAPVQTEKKPGGGEKIKGAEGKFGMNGPKEKTTLTGEPKPTDRYGGLPEVLEGDTGREIQQTLKSINTVANALAGLNAKDISLGGGSGTGLRGAGSGGGGNANGVAFGAGTLDTGWGRGAGGGGAGGAGGGGNGNGTGSGNGNGGGTGNGGAPTERKVSVGAGAGASRGALTQEQVRRVVVARTGALRACYESEAQKNPNLQGGVTVHWQIEPSGAVSSASVASSSLGSPRVEGCILRQVRSWKFPAADAPTGTDYPFKFGVGH